MQRDDGWDTLIPSPAAVRAVMIDLENDFRRRHRPMMEDDFAPTCSGMDEDEISNCADVDSSCNGAILSDSSSDESDNPMPSFTWRRNEEMAVALTMKDFDSDDDEPISDWISFFSDLTMGVKKKLLARALGQELDNRITEKHLDVGLEVALTVRPWHRLPARTWPEVIAILKTINAQAGNPLEGVHYTSWG